MAAGSIVLDLLMRTGSFETDTDRAAKRLKKFEREVQQTANAVRGAVTGLFGGLAAAFSVDAVATFVKATVDGIDALNDFSEAYGVTIERASALDDIARRNGQSLDTFGKAIQRINAALTDGGKGADVLAKLGLSAAELSRLSPDDQLLRVARAFATYADDGAKARDVQALFNRSAAEVVPLLNDYAAAGEAAGKVTKEQAEQAERFNKALSGAQAAITDIAREGTSKLLPYLTESARRFEEAARKGTLFRDTLVNLAKFAASPVAFVTNEMGRMLSGGEGDGRTGSWDAPRPSLANATPAPGRGGAGGGLNLALIDQYRSSSGRAPRTPTDYFNNAQDDLEDRIRKRLEAIEESEVRAIESEQRLRAESEITADAILMGYDQLEVARLSVPAALEEVGKAALQVSDAAREMGFSFNDALNEIIFNLDDANRAVSRFLKNIAGTLIQKYITGPAADGFTGFIDGLIKGQRANGGPVMGGSTYLVGERGPELFTPNTSGAIIPNGALGGGGNVQVIVNAPPGSQVERQETRQRGGMREVEIWLASRIGMGGPIDQALKARGALPRRA